MCGCNQRISPSAPGSGAGTEWRRRTLRQDCTVTDCSIFPTLNRSYQVACFGSASDLFRLLPTIVNRALTAARMRHSALIREAGDLLPELERPDVGAFNRLGYQRRLPAAQDQVLAMQDATRCRPRCPAPCRRDTRSRPCRQAAVQEMPQGRQAPGRRAATIVARLADADAAGLSRLRDRRRAVTS